MPKVSDLIVAWCCCLALPAASIGHPLLEHLGRSLTPKLQLETNWLSFSRMITLHHLLQSPLAAEKTKCAREEDYLIGGLSAFSLGAFGLVLCLPICWHWRLFWLRGLGRLALENTQQGSEDNEDFWTWWPLANIETGNRCIGNR